MNERISGRECSTAIIALLGLVALVLVDLPQKPVRYSWDSGKQCIVVYPDKHEFPCNVFTDEELNEFRLEYTDPHRAKNK